MSKRKVLLTVFLSFFFVVFVSSSVLFFLKGREFKRLYYDFKQCKNIVFTGGGIGNRMFEYAIGITLTKETGNITCYDVSYGVYETKVGHEIIDYLDNFDVGKEKKTSHNRHFFVDKTFNTLLKKIFNVNVIYIDHTKGTNNETVMQKAFKSKRNYYGQYVGKKWNNPFDYKIFHKYRNDIIKAFTLTMPLDEKNQQMLSEIKQYKNSVSIHIRRGDYQNISSLGSMVTIENYYNKALKIFENMDDVHYFVFSDDPEWVKNNLKTNKPTTYVDINDFSKAHFDLELMKNCKHNIIANSTFSWWGAYLNQNPDKVVVAPKCYCKRSCDLVLYPDDWKLINNEL